MRELVQIQLLLEARIANMTIRMTVIYRRFIWIATDFIGQNFHAFLGTSGRCERPANSWRYEVISHVILKLHVLVYDRSQRYPMHTCGAKILKFIRFLRRYQ